MFELALPDDDAGLLHPDDLAAVLALCRVFATDEPLTYAVDGSDGYKLVLTLADAATGQPLIELDEANGDAGGWRGRVRRGGWSVGSLSDRDVVGQTLIDVANGLAALELPRLTARLDALRELLDHAALPTPSAP